MYSKVRGELKKGKIPDRLLAEMQTIPINSIVSVKKLKTGLRILYQDGISDLSLRLNLADDPVTDKVLGILQERLGPDYVLKTEPISTGVSMGVSAIISIGAAAIAAYLFWVTQEVISGRAASTGSVQSPLLINLIESLGSTGVVFLGAFIFLMGLGISALFLLRPPTTTSLVHRE
jgi:hypothetical protein